MSYSRKTQIYEYFNSMGRNNEEFRRLLLGPMKDLEDQLCPIKQTVERMKQTLKTTKDEILWKNIHRMFTYNHRKLSVTHLYHSSTSVQLLILSALVFLENWYAVHEHSEFLVNDNWVIISKEDKNHKREISEESIEWARALAKGGFQELQQLEDVVVKIEKMKQDIQQLISGMIKYIDNVMKAISWSKKTGVNVKEPEEQFVNVSISYHLIDQLKKIVKN
ncbi:hypothetical protein ROZALSC1DRAFT_26101 [Rozella allomycis CSF55]|uniref:Uncharacterized protein n=1 Tax=Rozella allomycis (strain CSF55) TaxID=988480 RepID=A0A4P9Y982_ROZAC|nr:hypothetical protein ROZALSC1DRAFT_26101 [Rozella allomycis CSF55]